MALIDLVSADSGSAEDWYMEVGGKRVGYLYQVKDGWPVGVINPSSGDIGPFMVASSKADALVFALEALAKLHAQEN